MQHIQEELRQDPAEDEAVAKQEALLEELIELVENIDFARGTPLEDLVSVQVCRTRPGVALYGVRLCPVAWRCLATRHVVRVCSPEAPGSLADLTTSC